MKKLLLICISFILLFNLSVYAQKAKVVEDKFYGTKYYQTDWITIGGKSGNILFRIRSLNGSDNILLEAQYVGFNTYTVSAKDNFILRFKDDSTLNLTFEGSIPTYASGVISGVMWRTYTIDASVDITAIEKMETLTAVRVETSQGFSNFEVKENAAKKLITAFDNVKKALEQDKVKK